MSGAGIGGLSSGMGLAERKGCQWRKWRTERGWNGQDASRCHRRHDAGRAQVVYESQWGRRPGPLSEDERSLTESPAAFPSVVILSAEHSLDRNVLKVVALPR